MTLEPKTIEEAQALLAGQRGVVTFTGGGTKIGPLAPDAVAIRTLALNRIVEYAPSDQVVTAEAGGPVAAPYKETAEHGPAPPAGSPRPGRGTVGGDRAG